MEKRISHFAVHKTSLTASIIIAIGSIPMLIFAAIPASIGGSPLVMLLMIFMPVLYLIFGYVFVALSCWIYNFLVRKTKLGIVVTMDDVPAD